MTSRCSGRRPGPRLTSPIRPRSRPPSTASSTSSTRWRRRARVIETGATAKLRAASRDALAAVVEKFDDVAGRPRRRRTDHARRRSGLGGQAAASRAGAGQASGRAVPTIPPPKVRLVDRLLSGKVGDHALDLVQDRRVAALVGRGRPDRRHRAHRAAGPAGARRASTTRSTTSRTSCSGSAASSTPSRG